MVCTYSKWTLAVITMTRLQFTGPDRLSNKQGPQLNAWISMENTSRRDFLGRLGAGEAGMGTRETSLECGHRGERTESDVFIWGHFGVRKEPGTMETPIDLQTMRPAKIPSNIG